MTVKPFVSILIPAYNAEKWISDTLRSALAQTYPHREIIVVDDGSEDDTLRVVQQFETDGVRVVTQKNQGAAATRNAAYKLCVGDYIQWLDADDLLSQNKIEKQLELAEQIRNKRVLLSSGWSYFFYRYYRAQFVPTPLWCDLTTTEWLFRKMSQNLHMQTATWLVSRELAEAAGPWNTNLLGDDDGEYFCRVLLASDGVRFAPDARVYYRAAGTGSLSHIGTSNRKQDAQWVSMELHIGYLRSLEDTPRTRAACVAYMQNWLIFFYPERLDLVQKMQSVAKDLGGELQMPRLSWKYSWIASIF
jgi:glycosyltransferase involved in cell wall biosynthesis